MKHPSAIHYQLLPHSAAAHLLHVVCRIAQPDPNGQQLRLPAWIPGSYLIREFARHIVWLRAECNGKPVAVTKLDKASWQCEPVNGELLVSYEVYACDLSVRGAYFDSQRLFFNGTSVFVEAVGQESSPCRLTLAPREFAARADWQVATALQADQTDKHGFGSYQAADYDELIDHPIEISAFQQIRFKARGVPHQIVISGRHHADMQRLARDVQRICEWQIDFFGGKAPFERYVFLVMAVGEGYGGLEHRASTALLCSRDDLPRSGEDEVGDAYRGFLGLVSHEYFHSWNVKRIKPAAFAPYDLSRENYTRLLWAFEGITSYYDDLALVRTGLISVDDYLNTLAQTMTSVQRGTGRLKQTLEDASLDAWIKYYRQDENSPNALVSYYTKGALAALVLDMTIRERSHGEKSLDDVMQALWRLYLDLQLGLDEEAWESVAAEATGLDLRDCFDRLLRSTEELPLAEALAHVGVELTLRPAESATDKGGKAAAQPPERLRRRPVLGVRTAAEGAGVKLTHVLDGGAAQAAGLSANDIVLAMDGLRVTAGNLDKLLERCQVGDRVPVHAFRRDELMVFDVTLQAPANDTVVLSLIPQPSAFALAARLSWLGQVA